MVYKHAITTINPIKAIHLNFLSEAFKEAGGGREKEPVRREAPLISPNAPSQANQGKSSNFYCTAVDCHISGKRAVLTPGSFKI